MAKDQCELFLLDVYQEFATHTSATWLQKCLEVAENTTSKLASAVISTTRSTFVRGNQRHKLLSAFLANEILESHLGQGRFQKTLKVVGS